MTYIILESGERFEIDGTPHYIGQDRTLYVYVPNGYGYGYEPIGKVKKIVAEEESE